MESIRLFVSKDEKYFVNLYIDVTLYEKDNTNFTFKKRLGKMKNPYTVCFSHNGELVAVENNNNLIEVYNLNSGLRIFKGKGARAWGGNIYFLDDTTLLSSTYDGMVYTLDISTGNVVCHFNNRQLRNVEIVEISPSKYLILGNEIESNTTSIYSLFFENLLPNIKLLYSASLALHTRSACWVNNKLYAVSAAGNELLIYNINENSNLEVKEECIHILNQSDVVEFTKHAFDIIHQIAPDVASNLSPSLFPIGIASAFENKYVIVAFNFGLIVLDVKENKCVSKLPLKAGISSILVTDKGEHIWLSSATGLQLISISDII